MHIGGTVQSTVNLGSELSSLSCHLCPSPHPAPLFRRYYTYTTASGWEGGVAWHGLRSVATNFNGDLRQASLASVQTKTLCKEQQQQQQREQEQQPLGLKEKRSTKSAKRHAHTHTHTQWNTRCARKVQLGTHTHTERKTKQRQKLKLNKGAAQRRKAFN